MTSRSDASLESMFSSMYPRIQAFLNDTLSVEDVDDSSYVDGSTKIDFYAAPFRDETRLSIEEYKPGKDSNRSREFEEALFERLLQDRPFNMLVLLGGLGAGKTTTVKYLLRRFDDRRDQIMNRFICTCTGCFRRPIYLDFRSLDPERALSRGTIVPDVLHEMRLATYEQIVLEWLQSCGNSVARIKANDRDFMVLRRLFIANDLLYYQGSEFAGLSELHDSNLTLEAPLTSMRMEDSDLIRLINIYKPHASAYRTKLEKVVTDPYNSLDFMRLTLKFYLPMQPLKPS